MKKRLLLIIQILLNSVSLCSCCNQNSYKPSDKEKITDEIMANAAKIIKNDLHLIPCGFGGRAMYKVEMLHLAFDYHQPVDIKTGRELLIKATKIFAEEINKEERVRQYLNKYPFDVNDAHIVIFINDQNYKHIPNSLDTISAEGGILCYDDYSNQKLVSIEETYEEALQKLEMEGPHFNE